MYYFLEIKMSAEVSANISVSTSINCNVTSSQHVNITWIKDGYDLIADSNMEIHEVFLDNSPYSLVTISTIEFLAVQSSDSGWYNCTMASINNVSSASSAVYLSIQKDPVSTTEELTAISTSIASTVATTSGIYAQQSQVCMNFFVLIVAKNSWWLGYLEAQ